MARKVCAVCDEYCNSPIKCESLPNKHLLSQGYNSALNEYKVNGMILSLHGIEGNIIFCCSECHSNLKNGKLPPVSIANGFQIGSVPQELCELTIPEKLLISAYRTRMCVIKLKKIAGPQTGQYALKENSITFPQDTVKTAALLPCDINNLPEMLKVIFVGNNKPTKEQLKKHFQVRRKNVTAALKFLKENHPQYKNISIGASNIEKLPECDIPNSIWDTISHCPDDQADKAAHGSYSGTTIDNLSSEKD